MPLYSNILSNIRKKDGEGGESSQAGGGGGGANSAKSSSGLKLLQDHLLSKQRLKQQSQLQKKQQQRQAGGRSHLESSHVIISECTLHKPQENEWDQEEEYDPVVPNSYELLQAEQLRAEEEKRLASRVSATLSGKKINTSILDVLDELENDDHYNTGGDNNDAGTKGKAIAPPPSLTLTTSPSSVSNILNPLSKASASTTNVVDAVGTSKAINIMAKMGYKVGAGLGKNEQGISEPLEVEKSGLMTGKILPAAPSQASIIEQQQQKKLQVSTEVITRVLLLQNMVGPGEVDGDLEAETKEECRKYGDVVKCLIFEIPNNLVPNDQAVRIFVEFTTPESTAKAKADLDGRYFGGRIVKASFYSEEKFNKYELGP